MEKWELQDNEQNLRCYLLEVGTLDSITIIIIWWLISKWAVENETKLAHNLMQKSAADYDEPL